MIRRGGTITGMPTLSPATGSLAAWVRTPPWWAAWGWALVWAVGLLAPTFADPGSLGDPSRSTLALVAIVIVGACFSVSVATSLRVPARGGWRQWTLLAVQVVAAAALAAIPGLAWTTIPVMLALTAAISLDISMATAMVPVVAVAATVVQHARGESWAEAGWSTGLITALAGFLTLALSWLGALVGELERTRHRLARVAVTEERLRISRDMHDLLGHTLSVVVVKAQAARRSAPVDVDATVQHATDIETVGRQALTEVREAVRGYRSRSLPDELAQAVATLSEAGLETRVLRRTSELSPRHEQLFGWVVREGTTNVLRHSGASSVTIAVDAAERVSSVTIRDDGAGGSLPTRDGSGLTGLRERVEAEGGVLTASGDGHGFTLVATVPAVRRERVG